jgi:L-glyceraldehyde 3-phosphate reductase
VPKGGPEQEGGQLETAAHDGFGVIVYSPLAQGLLTSKYLESIPEG